VAEIRLDGIDLTFQARNGKAATIHLESLAIKRERIVQKALNSWLQDGRNEREHLAEPALSRATTGPSE
jgi:hypothetical protein